MERKKKKGYSEGIPLTTAEGESTIEDIDLELSVVSKSLRT
jgi:hypothetical protein